MDCPIARSLERVGEWWSMLILRDAFAGMTRFDQFQRSLGIATNILQNRLAGLVEAGMLDRHAYAERPARYDYKLTARGRDFHTVLIAMLAFGNRHFAPEGESVMIVDAETGKRADLILADRETGRRVAEPDFKLVAGPSASPAKQNALANRDASLLPSLAETLGTP